MKTLRSKLHAARQLKRDEWRLIGQAWILLLQVELRLQFQTFPRIQAWAQAGRRPPLHLQPLNPQTDQPNLAQVKSVHLAIQRAAALHLIPMTCLRRSLALQRLLAKKGIASQLRFGARKEAGEVKAHAWVEYQGQPLGEPLDLEARFIPLVTRPR